MHPLVTIMLTLLSTAGGAPLAELARRSSLLGGSAGGVAGGYAGGHAPAAQRAVSHIRQQIYAAAAPRMRLAPSAAGYHSRTLHAPPATPVTDPHAEYAAAVYAPAYDAGEDEYYVEESEDEPLYVAGAADAAPEIYDAVMYARPNERGGYSYRRRPSRPPAPARRPPPPSAPFIIKIHKRKIIRD